MTTPNDMSKWPDREFKNKINEWYEAMFTATSKGADINSVLLYSPLIQTAQNELTGRIVKRTTWIVIVVAVATLLVSVGSLYVSISALQISKEIPALPEKPKAAPGLLRNGL